MNRTCLWLSLATAVLMAIASAAGIFLPSTYARETATWATQGKGQDIANLFIVFPAMLVAIRFALRGRLRAALIALGLLIYVAYSYVLYAFFIHFGPLFPIYVAVLGLSSSALFGAVIHMDRSKVPHLLAGNPKAKLASGLLFAFGLLFALQWLSEIVSALLAGAVPRSATEIGAPVNPVHVIDLAFILPGMIVTAIAARRGKPLGLLFAAPLLVFSAAMSIAIVSMFGAERARGVPLAIVPLLLVSAVCLLSIYGAWAFSRELRQ